MTPRTAFTESAISTAAQAHVRPARPTFWRTTAWDVVPTTLALAYATLLGALIATGTLHAGVVGIGLWWFSNAIVHPFIHRPFFTSRRLNHAFAAFASIVNGYPFEAWRARHLAHHAEIAGTATGPRLRRFELGMQSIAIAAGAALLIAYDPALFVTAVLPGWGLGLGLAALQGYFEHHRGGTTSNYGRLYNLLFLNDGYHVEHHANAGLHWRELPRSRRRGGRGTDEHASRWPAVLRVLDLSPLNALERLALGSRRMKRVLVDRHLRAFRAVGADRLEPGRVTIVGGGLFPRSAHVCHRLWPDAVITLLDRDPRHLERAAEALDFPVTLRRATYEGEVLPDAEVVVIPLAYRGRRSDLVNPPPAPHVFVHDWIWRPRGRGTRSAVVAFWLLKRVSRIDREAER